MTSTLTMKKWSDVDVTPFIWNDWPCVSRLSFIRWCNYLALDDKTAKNLGINVNLVRLVISLVAVLLASVATAVAGLFAFVACLYLTLDGHWSERTIKCLFRFPHWQGPC